WSPQTAEWAGKGGHSFISSQVGDFAQVKDFWGKYRDTYRATTGNAPPADALPLLRLCYVGENHDSARRDPEKAVRSYIKNFATLGFGGAPEVPYDFIYDQVV